MDRLRQQFIEMVGQARDVVFLGGAGVSVPSGIPDFRSTGGLYSQPGSIPPEVVISHGFFMAHPAEFYKFYRQKMIYADARPNDAHKALAKLERQGKVSAVVTQNIDGLHQQAGSCNVLELHGSVLRNNCMDCGAFYGLAAVLTADDIPRCRCGGIIKPDVVLYEEPLDPDILSAATGAITRCDLLIVGGTSLSVYPAAGLVDLSRGKLVVVNRDATPADTRADLVLTGSIDRVFAPFL